MTLSTTHFRAHTPSCRSVAFSSDRGGNSISGSFFGSSVNLHALWDSSIIDQRMKQDFGGSQEGYVNFLLGGITTANQTAWTSCFASVRATINQTKRTFCICC
jgi:hypothetical protein